MSGPVGASQWMYSSGEFDIGQSLKFNDDESQYLSWTPASAGNRKTWTWSGWLKRGAVITANVYNHTLFGDSTGAQGVYLRVNPNDPKIEFGCGNGSIVTNGLFRDHSAWYHIVAQYDSANSSIKLYINGEEVTDASITNPTLNNDGLINNTSTHYIGRQGGTSQYLDGYLADVYFIDGTALDPTSFGETVDGYWKPIAYDGTYGSNGFHLNFKDDIVSEGFNAVTYRGTGSTQSVSGLGFSPDLVWYKRRNSAASHQIYDLIRGVGNTMFTNATSAESFDANVLQSFDIDGFTIGSEAGSNSSGDNFVAWCWDAGTGSPASNTDGDITSTVKANPSYGFSVVSYTGNGTPGSTIGHGLSSAPEMIIAKVRNAARDWPVYHSALGGTKFLALDLTMAASTSNVIWYDTNPTSSVFTVGSDPWINNSSDNYIAYCFHSVSGYSKFTTYTSNGSTTGPVVTCGFRPAFVLLKNTSTSATNWLIFDNTRSPNSSNVIEYLKPNDSAAEGSLGGSQHLEFTDTGFEIKTSSGDVNPSGGDTYIVAAFADTREYAFWKDVSGNGNHWTPNNLDYRDSLPDTPTNNFAVLNPLDINSSGGMTLSEGNLKLTSTNAGSAYCSFSNIVLESGGWYSEVYVNGQTGGYPNVGIGDLSKSPTANEGIFAVKGVGYAADGNVYRDGGTIIDTVSSFTTGDVIGIAYDADNQKIYFSKNGTWQNSADPAAGTNGYTVNDPIEGYVFGASIYSPSPVTFSFGQDSTFAGAKAMGSYTDDNGIGNFQYAPPTGYLSLCTSNLPTPTIVDGSQHFNTLLWTGNGSTTQTITGVGFDPDFVWIKNRTSVLDHNVYDVIRGDGKKLKPNKTDAETDVGTDFTFETDGFFVGNRTETNESGSAIVGWNWKAGGTAVSNTDGSITSQVSANTDMGFSVVSWSGSGSAATVGHSLGVAPSMVIVKNRIDARNWSVWHQDLSSNDYYLRLDSTDAQASAGANYWNSTAPTSSVFSVGVEGDVNDSGDGMIAYCFANSDIIKVGSYTGNGSTDGPFVYTGFRPAWVMWKRTDAADSWYMYDAERNPFNVVNAQLYANSSGAEYVSGDRCDFLSNGFKLKTINGGENASGGSYIYLAIAETPFKYANAR